MQLSLCLLDFQSEWSSCEEISFLCLFHALNTFALSCIFFTYKHVRSALSLMNTIAVHVLKVPNCHNDVSFYTFNFLRPYLYVAILSYVFSSCLSFSVMLVQPAFVIFSLDIVQSFTSAETVLRKKKRTVLNHCWLVYYSMDFDVGLRILTFFSCIPWIQPRTLQ